MEKNVTLDLALRLNHILVVGFGYQTRLSRTTDVFSEPSARAAAANSWGADLYVAIHINAGGGTGFESYRATSVSWWTAIRHQILHEDILKQIRGVAAVTDRGMKTRNFTVLTQTNMSAILTENLFIDRASDAALLKRNDNRHAIAVGHANGIRRMFS